MADSMEVRRRVLAKLISLKPQLEKHGGTIEERYVREFHVELDRLEALGDDVAEFRIAGSDVNPIVTATHMDGRRSYSETKYVASAIFLPRLECAIAATEAKAKTNLMEAGDDMRLIELICTRFGQIARQLRRRHDDRKTLDVRDEFDVQDLMHAILRLHFDDIRPEEWTPSYAGGSARMDFLLKQQQTVIEVKKTREGLRDSKLGEQLIIDKERYQKNQDCKVLVCFVYDPDGYIANPVGLASDLERGSTNEFAVRVLISS